MRRIADGGQGQMSQRGCGNLAGAARDRNLRSVLTQRAWKGINKNGNVPVCPGFIFAKFTLDIDR